MLHTFAEEVGITKVIWVGPVVGTYAKGKGDGRVGASCIQHKQIAVCTDLR